ncbi:hypothetical protein Bca4012_101417 [Brassica carinata]
MVMILLPSFLPSRVSTATKHFRTSLRVNPVSAHSERRRFQISLIPSLRDDGFTSNP